MLAVPARAEEASGRDIEGVYLIGDWPAGFQGRSSMLETNARSHCNGAA